MNSSLRLSTSSDSLKDKENEPFDFSSSKKVDSKPTKKFGSLSELANSNDDEEQQPTEGKKYFTLPKKKKIGILHMFLLQ